MNGAAVMIPTTDGRFLAVSRGRDRTDWSLPGGHREPGEPLHVTAARELFEETGVYVSSDDLRHLVENVFYIDENADVSLPAVYTSRPFEGFVAFQPPEVLAAGRHGRTFKRALTAATRRSIVRL